MFVINVITKKNLAHFLDNPTRQAQIVNNLTLVFLHYLNQIYRILKLKI